MSTPAPTYTKLTRNTARATTYDSLWLGPDHLLVVSSTGYHETYSRIMLADIKALFITPTGRRLWWGLAWGLIAAAAGVRIGFLLTYGEWPIGSGIFFGLGVLGLTLNWFRGPGCRVHVMTGVQNTVLPSLVRLPKTRAVIERLRPLILAAQAARATGAAEPASVPPAPPSGPAAVT